MKNVDKFPNATITVRYKDEQYLDNNLDYPSFVQYISNLAKEEIDTIEKIFVNPNGDNLKELLCGTVTMWKKHDSKELFERYYTLSEMMRSLYMNEYEADGRLVDIYIDIKGERFAVNWTAELKPVPEEPKGEFVLTSEIYNDTFAYRNARVEEYGLMNLLADKFPYRPNDVYDDMNRLINNPNFIEVYDDNITLKQCKEIYQAMSHLGFAQQNIRFNVET